MEVLHWHLQPNLGGLKAADNLNLKYADADIPKIEFHLKVPHI